MMVVVVVVVVCLAARRVAAFHASYVLYVVLPIMCVHSIVVRLVAVMSCLERVLLVVA